MKSMFIEAKKKSPDIKLDFSVLPERVGLLYTIQYKELFEKIRKELEKTRKVVIGKSLLAEGQVLGCRPESALAIENKIDCFFLVSSGRFHAMSLALRTGVPIYIIGERGIEFIQHEEIDILRKKRKAAISKFIFAERVGIIVSTKPGQQNLKEAIELKNKIKKKSFIFITSLLYEKIRIKLIFIKRIKTYALNFNDGFFNLY